MKSTEKVAKAKKKQKKTAKIEKKKVSFLNQWDNGDDSDGCKGEPSF